MSYEKQTPSQTIGPFFSYGLTPQQYDYDYSDLATGDLVADGIQGEAINLIGTIYNGDGQELRHAIIESWQADSMGRYAKMGLMETFSGFARVGTGRGEDPRYRIRTVKPGRVDQRQAPHIALTLFSRGLMHHVYTRLYFSDEEEANEKDPLLQRLPAHRRQTLIAKRVEAENVIFYQFDIHMQGNQETVFLEF